MLNPREQWVFGDRFLPSRVRGRIIYQQHVGASRRFRRVRGVELAAGPDPANGEPQDSYDYWGSAWLEGNDLILIWDDSETGAVPAETARRQQTHAKHINDILDTVEGKQPNVTGHPGFVSALAEGKDLKGFEADGLFFIWPGDDRGLGRWMNDLDAGPTTAKPAPHIRSKTNEDASFDDLTPDQIDKLGFNGIKRIVGRWGFQDKALVADVRIEAPAPRKGAMACFDQPAIRTDRLPPWPAGIGTFVVGSFDLARIYQGVANTTGSLDLDDFKEFAKWEQGLQQTAGLRLREDLLEPIGPTWCVVEVPPATKGGSKRYRAALRDHVLVASLKDIDKAAKVIDTLTRQFDPAGRFWDIFLDNVELEKQKAARVPRIEPLPKPDRGYTLVLNSKVAAKGESALQPTLLLGNSVVVLAWDQDQARRTVAADLGKAERWKPAGELAHALDVLPRDVTLLSVMDNAASSVPDGVTDLPWMIQTVVNQWNEPDLDNASIWSLLDLFGAPRPGGIRIRGDRSRLPDPDRVRRGLFPSVLAIATDDRGFRIIGREALPFVAIAGEASYRYSWTAGWHNFLPHFEESFSLTFPRFNWEE